jgi:kynurenine formamidase
MCSPVVAKAVQERIAREGLPQISRRGLLKMGGIGAAAFAAASVGLPARKAAADGHGSMGVVDLSHVFATVMPTYTPGETPTREPFVTVEENGYFIQYWTLYEHAGTHCDFPAHFIADGTTVDNYPAGTLLAPAVVIDITAKAAENPDAMVEPEDLEAYEAAHGEIPEGAIVFMNSGWDARWNDVDAYRNADEAGVLHFPGFSGAAVNWLIEERGINGIGVDTLSLDPGNSTTFDVHYAICGSDKFGIENVANIAAIQDMADAKVIVGIPRWEGSGGGPARILALVSE